MQVLAHRLFLLEKTMKWVARKETKEAAAAREKATSSSDPPTTETIWHEVKEGEARFEEVPEELLDVEPWSPSEGVDGELESEAGELFDIALVNGTNL